MFHEAPAERVSDVVDDKSIKLMYGSPPYPLIKRNYGYWTEDAWMADMQRWMTALRPKMRDDGFVVVNVKAGRVTHKGGNSTRSLIVEDFYAWMVRELGVHLVDVEIWSKKDPAPTGLRAAAQDAYEYLLWFSMSNPWTWNMDAIRRPYDEKTLTRYSSKYRPRQNGNGYVTKEKFMVANPLGAMPRNVISLATTGTTQSHQATQREDLPERYILACTDPGDLVWDMWLGTGTTARTAIRLGRRAGGTDVDMSHLNVS